MSYYPDFDSIWSNLRTFDIRRNDDAKFKVGDQIILKEYNPNKYDNNIKPFGYSGREVHGFISHVLEDNLHIYDGYTVISFKETHRIHSK